MVTVFCALFILSRAIASLIRCRTTSRILCAFLDSPISGILCRSGINTGCLSKLALHGVAAPYETNEFPAKVQCVRNCVHVTRIPSSIFCKACRKIPYLHSIVRACCWGAFGLRMVPLFFSRVFASTQFRENAPSITSFYMIHGWQS